MGESNEADTGENMGQSPVEGAVISAASIDYTVGKYFPGNESEISYGNLNLRPLIFQDDIARISTSVIDAQVGNIKLSSCMESKLLDFNVEKCGFMVFGSKRSKRIIENQLSQTPLTLKGENVRNVKVEKYLGDYLSEDGLSDSVHRTVLKRKGQTIACINEIRAILEDCRSGVKSGT